MARLTEERTIEVADAGGKLQSSSTRYEHEQRPLVLIGSARKDGDTHRLVNTLFPADTAIVCDLLDHRIYPYDYTGRYPADDAYRQITEQILAHHTLVWVTPVYWYAMSGTMKTVFDRFTDLITKDRHLGRRLAGKRMFLAAAGADPGLPEGFEEPFMRTANYLDMYYGGAIYTMTGSIGDVLKEEGAQNWLSRLNAVPADPT